MSDGGFDIDRFMQQNRQRTNLFGITTDPITKQRVSFPSVPTNHSEKNLKSNSTKSRSPERKTEKTNSAKPMTSKEMKRKNSSFKPKNPDRSAVINNFSRPRTSSQGERKTSTLDVEYKVKCVHCSHFNECKLKDGFDDLCPYD